jgi:uroporphyrinogen-III synthase
MQGTRRVPSEDSARRVSSKDSTQRVSSSKDSTRRVLVTRPADQAKDWAARLCGAGIDAVALPLIGIGPLHDTGAVTAVWQTLDRREALMFVSANAAAQFFAARPAGISWPSHLIAAAPGPGTSAALRGAGVPAASIVEPQADAARFDSESLWAAMSRASWQGRSVLILRGGSDDADAQGQGREWLAERLREAGAEVESLAVYRRMAPEFDAAERIRWQAALDAPAAHLWLFSSSESVDHGEARAQAEGRAVAWHAATAVTTHPRIAQHARELGFADVVDAKAGFAEVAETLKSLVQPPAP